VEIMIVVAIIGLLAAIAIPNFVKARATSQMNASINNLRLIDSSKQQWALEQLKLSTDTPQGADLQPHLGRGAAGEMP
jgi:type II secretory pathway pseudopilin PulG